MCFSYSVSYLPQHSLWHVRAGALFPLIFGTMVYPLTGLNPSPKRFLRSATTLLLRAARFSVCSHILLFPCASSPAYQHKSLVRPQHARPLVKQCAPPSNLHPDVLMLTLNSFYQLCTWCVVVFLISIPDSTIPTLELFTNMVQFSSCLSSSPPNFTPFHIQFHK